MNTPNIKIKELAAIHLPELLLLHDYDDPADMIAENTRDLEKGLIRIWGMYNGSEIIGEIRAKILSDDADFTIPGKRVYFYAFRVLIEHQGKGLGTILISHVINKLTNIGYSEFTIGVEDDNIAAKHLYQKLGFTRGIARKCESYQGYEYEYDLLLKTQAKTPQPSRLDVLLVSLGHFPSRAKAQAAITAGRVSVNGKTCTKSGQNISECDILDVVHPAIELVGRGGEKLGHALEFFALDLSGKVCLDVGASTGGFTQVCLAAGARRVFALDAGHSQLAESLCSDPRVLNLEGRNFRYFNLAELPEAPGFACVDVSFISLKLILPKLAECLSIGAEAVCLVKPQFEAGRGHLNKQGVVKDVKVQAQVLDEIAKAAQDCGFEVLGTCNSPILGGSGNREFLMHVRRV